jgi:hypothetical protein
MIDEALAAWAALTLRGIQTVGNRLAVTVTEIINGIVDITLQYMDVHTHWEQTCCDRYCENIRYS